MSKKKSRHTGRKVIVFLLVAAAAAGGGYRYYLSSNEETSVSLSAYKEEKVQRGTVATGVREDGTITFGTTEQTFEVAEITEVSTSSSSSSSSSSAAMTSSSSSGSTVAGLDMSSMSSSMSGTSSSSSGSSTSLVVEEVYVTTGQEIEAGDKILKITDDSISAYREELEAAVATAKLLVSQEEINVETKKAEADYTYQMYLAEGETAEETYNATIKSLEDAVSEIEEEIEDEDDEDELEDLEAQLKIAQNNLTTGTLEAKETYEQAMTNYKYADQLYEIDTDGLEDDLNDAQDTLTECEENLENFESQIGDGIVYAENAGTVTEVAYAAGDSITNEATILTCTDPEDVTMTVSISQDDISEVAVGDEVTVYLDAYDGESFPAEVTGISTTASTGSSTVSYEVTAALTGDTGKIYSGMTGEVNIAGKTVEDTLYISNQAVYLNGTASCVKVLNDDGTVTEQEITTGFSNGKKVAVESGLSEGQTVLIESQVTQ